MIYRVCYSSIHYDAEEDDEFSAFDSDYFSTREKAEEFAKKVSGDVDEITEEHFERLRVPLRG
jgi:hypothetical protein